MADAQKIVGVWEIQHYLAFESTAGSGTFGDHVRVTEDTKFETKNDDDEYKPKYLDRKKMPKYTMGRTTSIEVEIDAVVPGDIQAKLAACEDEVNVPVLYTRTLNYDLVSGKECPATALVAKQANATLTMDPISGDSGEPAKLTGTINITGDYTAGTFDTTTKKFTAATTTTTTGA
jgi:hypothetical protein